MWSLIPFRKNRELFTAPVGDWVDGFFEEFHPLLRGDGGGWQPSFDISETEEHIHVKADLPGIDVKDLDISIDNNVLTVRGEKKQEKEDKGENYRCVERHYGSFCRSFMLPAEVKSDGIEAVYKDGVLRLSVPKSEAAKPKRIEVKH
jgi:HSP20 family protein